MFPNFAEAHSASNTRVIYTGIFFDTFDSFVVVIVDVVNLAKLALVCEEVLFIPNIFPFSTTLLEI